MFKFAIGILVVAATSAQAVEILTGCWRGSVDGAVIEEKWGNARGGLMLGTAKTLAGDEAVEFEFLKIEVKDGGATYTPYINGVAAGPFTQDKLESDTRKLVFRNPENDFPKKIVYSRTEAALEISLEGDERVIRYTLDRIGCP